LKEKKKEEIFNNLGKFEAETDVQSVKCLANHQKEGNNEDRNWDWTVDQYQYSPTRTKKQKGYVGSYAMDNMAMSLNTIYKTGNFKDAMIRAANIRGDSDSVASVVGQIAGALYPLETIPGDWIKAIYRWDQGEIALRGYILSHY
jgi:ADP-ribosylglycohydrolase